MGQKSHRVSRCPKALSLWFPPPPPKLRGVLSKLECQSERGAASSCRFSTQLGSRAWGTRGISSHWAAWWKSGSLFAVSPYWGAVGSCCSLSQFFVLEAIGALAICCVCCWLSSISTKWSETIGQLLLQIKLPGELKLTEKDATWRSALVFLYFSNIPLEC